MTKRTSSQSKSIQPSIRTETEQTFALAADMDAKVAKKYNGESMEQKQVDYRNYFKNYHGRIMIELADEWKYVLQELPSHRTSDTGNADLIFRMLISDEQIADRMFLVATFIKLLKECDEDDIIEIQPPLNAVAYILTRECNRKTDLVRFLTNHIADSGDYIKAYTKKDGALQALETRIIYHLSNS